MKTTAMRAKLVVESVKVYPEPTAQGAAVIPETTSETVTFRGVCKDDYSKDPYDENNTYARYSPSARFEINIANPNLFGKFKQGQQFYADFTEVEAESTPAEA